MPGQSSPFFATQGGGFQNLGALQDSNESEYQGWSRLEQRSADEKGVVGGPSFGPRGTTWQYWRTGSSDIPLLLHGGASENLMHLSPCC